MSIELAVQPPFSSDWTSVTIEGEDEDALMNILVSRLAARNYEVEVQVDGEFIPFEDFELINREDDDGTDA